MNIRLHMRVRLRNVQHGILPKVYINYRMLQKAMYGSNGNLQTVAQRLSGITYFPRRFNSLIETVSTKTKCFGVEVIQPEFKVKGRYSLETD